ncbi:MAG: IPT/TIG domain-containing protein [Burkholderiales bacterium]|nr:IPT/TIG domain-containing protein [Burkholderiales bacterium]
MRRYLGCALLGFVLATLLSCGGGGGGGDAQPGATPPPGEAEITLSGAAAKGTISGAAVRATLLDGTGRRTQTTRQVDVSSSGAFSLRMPRGVTLLELLPTNATTSRDEATGAEVPISSGLVLRAALDTTSPASTTFSANLTPFSELATTLAERTGGLTSANIAVANAGVGSLIGADPVSTKPIQVGDLATAQPTLAEQRLSVMNAAVSQLAATDALGCGASQSYGAQIGCTVAALPNHVSLQTAGSTVATVSSSPTLVQAMVAGVEAVTSAVGSASRSVVSFVGSATYPLTADAAWQRAKADIDANVDLQVVASRTHVYAHLSKLMYEIDPGDSDTEPLKGRTDSLGRALPGGWRIVDWTKFPASARPTEFQVGGLAFNVFVHDGSQQVVFAYRGTQTDWEIFADLKVDVANTFFCGKTKESQYHGALNAFDTIVDALPQTPYAGYTILTTGHSLGGGLASYIALRRPDRVSTAIGFNSAPLCGVGGMWDQYFRGADPQSFKNVWHVVLIGEVVTATAFVGGYRPGRIDWFTAPVAWTNPAAGAFAAHGSDAVAKVLDYGRKVCDDAVCDAGSISAPTIDSTPIRADLVQPSLVASVVPYQAEIEFTGVGLKSLSRVELVCTDPNGAPCPTARQVWTPGDWDRRVEVRSGSSAIVRPVVLGTASAGAYGVYRWAITLASNNGSSVLRYVDVEYRPPELPTPVVTELSSGAFTPPGRSVRATAAPFEVDLYVKGLHLDLINTIQWKWGGATTGEQSWTRGDARWLSRVLDQKPDLLRLKPTVVAAGDSWSGDAVWTLSLIDHLGRKQIQTFSVSFGGNAPPVVTTPTISSISPTSMTANGNAQTLTINGSGFASGNYVQWHGSTWVTTNGSPNIISGNALTVSINPGTVNDTLFFRVCNSAGSCSASSNGLTVTAVVTTPTISSISPTSMTANGNAQTLTINGSGFASGNYVQWHGNASGTWVTTNGSPSIVSATRLTVSINPGTVNDTLFFRVCNSAGSCSASSNGLTVIR